MNILHITTIATVELDIRDFLQLGSFSIRTPPVQGTFWHQSLYGPRDHLVLGMSQLLSFLGESELCY